MNSKTLNFKREKCKECGQNINYLLPLDRGTSILVKAVATAIGKKRINIIHPTKEMEVPAKGWNYQRAITEGVLTSSQIGNLTRARVHGLLARVKGEAGNWCLTTKGANFLRGMKVPQFAVIKKTTCEDRSHKEEYFEPEAYQTDVYQLAKQGENWMAIDFEIVEGRIVEELPIKEDKELSSREIEIMRFRLGINEEKNCTGIKRTLESTAIEFGITKERVRQIEAKYFEKLKQIETTKVENNNQQIF